MVAAGNASSRQPEPEGCALSENGREREKEVGGGRRRDRKTEGVFPPIDRSCVCLFTCVCVCLRVCGCSLCFIMCVCGRCVSGQLSDTMIFCNHLGEYKKDELLEAAR